MKKPPKHLSDRVKELWGQVVPRRCKHPEELALLQSALESLDRADQAAAILAKDGLVTVTAGSGTKHRHPMIDVEKEARAAFVKAWQMLNLQWVPSGQSDPSIRNTGMDELARGK